MCGRYDAETAPAGLHRCRGARKRNARRRKILSRGMDVLGEGSSTNNQLDLNRWQPRSRRLQIFLVIPASKASPWSPSSNCAPPFRHLTRNGLPLLVHAGVPGQIESANRTTDRRGLVGVPKLFAIAAGERGVVQRFACCLALCRGI